MGEPCPVPAGPRAGSDPVGVAVAVGPPPGPLTSPGADDPLGAPAPGDPGDMTWESPLHWRVRISGNRRYPIVEIFDPLGGVFMDARTMTAAELDVMLP